MKKHMKIAFFAMQALLIASASAEINPFAKLDSQITREAATWAQEVTNTLSFESQLAYLNFFASMPTLGARSLSEEFIHSAQYIQSHPDIASTHEQLSINIMLTLKKYAEHIQNKIESRKDISNTEKETLLGKLQMKIQELVLYINAIYYQALHNAMAEENAERLTYIFDKDGFITEEKRVTLLPTSL